MTQFKLIIFILVTFISIQEITAQATVSAPKQYASTWRTIQMVRDLLNTQSRDQPIDYNDIKGSPYENEVFKLGKVYLNDSLLGQFMLRFNNYANELEVLSDEKNENGELIYEAFLKLDGLSFNIDDANYKLIAFKNGENETEKNYLKELVMTGKHKLYQYSYTKLTPARKAVTFNEVDRAARFTTYTEFYITKDGSLISLPTKKKLFLEFFSSNNSALKNYLRKEKLKLDDPKQLSKAIEFINRL